MMIKKIKQWSHTHSRQQLALLALIVLIINIALYFGTLQHDFLKDDFRLIVENSRIKSFQAFWQAIDGKFFAFPDFPYLHYWRPLSLFSFYLDYQIWGLNPAGFHLTNIILNGLNALLVFFIFYEITRNWLYALPTSLFFSFHPCHVEAASWISGRTDLLAAFFLLSALMLFLLYQRHKRLYLYILTILFFLMALLSKENGVLFPLVAMAVIFARPLIRENNTNKTGSLSFSYPFKPRALLITIPFWALDIGYILLHNHFSGVQNVLSRFSFKDIFIIMKTIGAYTRTILLPFIPTPHFSMNAFDSSHLPFLAYFLLAIFILVWMVIKRHAYRYSLFSLLFFIFLLPVIDPEIVPSYPKIVIRFAYIPSIFAGIFFVESIALLKQIRIRRIATGFLILIAVIWMAQSIAFQRYYKDELSHYNGLLPFYPNDGSLVLPMALIKAGQGKTNESLQLVNHALKINDNDPWLDNYQMAGLLKANLLVITGNSEEGKELVETILAQSPKNEMVYFGHLILATYHQKKNQFIPALEMLKKAREAGETADLFYRLAVGHAYIKEYSQAIDYLEKAKQMNPELPKYKQLKTYLLNLIKQSGITDDTIK
jgi:hypothetical protein